MLPSVDATMMVLPEDDGPNSFDKSTLIVRMFPSTNIWTFFMRILLALVTPRYSRPRGPEALVLVVSETLGFLDARPLCSGDEGTYCIAIHASPDRGSCGLSRPVRRVSRPASALRVPRLRVRRRRRREGDLQRAPGRSATSDGRDESAAAVRGSPREREAR